MYLMLYFNSIKVRLKQNILKEGLIVHLFQFHKGTIKTLLSRYCLHKLRVFQFHKGTIKTQRNTKLRPFPQYFNSIKVRLKRFALELVGCVLEFQFHKGTIKTSAYADASDPLCDFNSIKVRLKLQRNWQQQMMNQ